MTTTTPEIEFFDVIVHVFDPARGWTTRPAPRPGDEPDPLD